MPLGRLVLAQPVVRLAEHLPDRSFHQGRVGESLVDPLRGTIEHLAERQARHREAIAAQTDAERRIERNIEPALRDVEARRREVLERLGLDERTESSVDDWLEERPRFRGLQKELAAAETLREDRRRSLAEEFLIDSESNIDAALQRMESSQ